MLQGLCWTQWDQHTCSLHRICVFHQEENHCCECKGFGPLWMKISETGLSEKYGRVKKLGLVYGTWITANNMEISHPVHSGGRRSIT